MDNNEQRNVLFFRRGKQIYFKFEDCIKEVVPWTIHNLKNMIVLPFKVEFIGCSRAEVDRIITDLYDNGVEVSADKIDSKPGKGLHFIVTFSEKKNRIDTYKVPNINCLYGRTNNNNPYIIINLNDKKILLEVTKDYAKKNEGDYYFLADDLTIQEREFFASSYNKMEFDFIYRLQEDSLHINNSKVLKKRIR